MTKFGSPMPSGVVPQDQQTSNESSTLDRHFGHCHMVLGSSPRKSKIGPPTDYTTDGIEARSSRRHAANGPGQSEIGKPEPISLNDITNGHWDLRAELWAPEAV